MLTEAEAWDKIAEWWENPEDEGTKYRPNWKGNGYCGICGCIGDLACCGHIDTETVDSMLGTIDALPNIPTYDDVSNLGFKFPRGTREGAKMRAEFCRKMAAQCRGVERAKTTTV